MKSVSKLNSFRIKNFKAIRDSRTIRLSPLTVLIGNNGSGKSSIVEALEMLQAITLSGFDQAMESWHGFEHVWNQAVSHELTPRIKDKKRLPNPMLFSINGKHDDESVKLDLELSLEPDKNRMSIHYRSNTAENATFKAGTFPNRYHTDMFGAWQFLKLQPHSMFEPVPQKRTPGKIKLDKTGSNIAEYLQSIRDMDIPAFDGIIDTLKFVLPYASDLKPDITKELERKIYLLLSEKGIPANLPGWLLSTGTVRILALLSVLRHPEPPPLIVIEEIENGLDPRTIHMLVEEIRSFVEDGLGQVLITTHSPYLLDLLPLSSIITVERDNDGAPVFNRPADEEKLRKWSQNFTPGRLYTMGTLTGRGK
ncbi:MAG: AAA family ATPase [Candidatus Latescibacteria bacterium]|nr:AAA family ATPase [Candidatus Latescibacterota bacterium]